MAPRNLAWWPPRWPIEDVSDGSGTRCGALSGVLEMDRDPVTPGRGEDRGGRGFDRPAPRERVGGTSAPGTVVTEISAVKMSEPLASGSGRILASRLLTCAVGHRPTPLDLEEAA